MAALWMAVYLTLGVLALWACYSSEECRVRSRLERNSRIVSAVTLPHRRLAGERQSRPVAVPGARR